MEDLQENQLITGEIRKRKLKKQQTFQEHIINFIQRMNINFGMNMLTNRILKNCLKWISRQRAKIFLDALI